MRESENSARCAYGYATEIVADAHTRAYHRTCRQYLLAFMT